MTLAWDDQPAAPRPRHTPRHKRPGAARRAARACQRGLARAARGALHPHYPLHRRLENRNHD